MRCRREPPRPLRSACPHAAMASSSTLMIAASSQVRIWSIFNGYARIWRQGSPSTAQVSMCFRKPDRRFHALIDKVWREAFSLKPGGGCTAMAGLPGWTERPSRTSNRIVWRGALVWEIGAGTEEWDVHTEAGPAGRCSSRRNSPASFGPWAFPAYGTGWRRHRPCSCLSRYWKRTCNRSSTPTGRGGAPTTR